MSETSTWVDGPAASDENDQFTPAEPETTGDEAVDVVVASLRGLDDLPVSEHVAIFEGAHDSLRQVLSGAGEPAQPVQVSQV